MPNKSEGTGSTGKSVQLRYLIFASNTFTGVWDFVKVLEGIMSDMAVLARNCQKVINLAKADQESGLRVNFSRNLRKRFCRKHRTMRTIKELSKCHNGQAARAIADAQRLSSLTSPGFPVPLKLIPFSFREI